MLLEPDEIKVLVRLHRSLMFFVNERLRVLPDTVASPEEYAVLSPQLRVKVHGALNRNLELIDSFVEENPNGFWDDELEIIRSWRHLVHGKFYVLRELAKCTVFLSASPPAVAYGVHAVSQPFDELIGPYLPVLTETVLLPFRGKIVYDGLISTYKMSFGPEVRRSLNEHFKEAKARNGIVLTLPISATPSPPKSPRRKSAPKAPTGDGKNMVFETIVSLTNDFCKTHLNEEYAELCRKLAEKLARKRPSPLLSGKPNTWACGIVRAIGMVNFLDDRSRLNENPQVWMINVNGFLLDARHLKREIQEEALRQGLIPYIPERPDR